MKLIGDSNSVTILPIAREFPERGPNTEEPDWLIVALDVETRDGSWSARAACLTTREARWIGKWLRWVVAGGGSPTAIDDRAFGLDLSFEEPLLAFKAALGMGPGVEIRIRVYVSYWLAPPWLDTDQASNLPPRTSLTYP